MSQHKVGNVIHQSPVNVRSMVSNLQREDTPPTRSPRELSPSDGQGLVKSRSFNDIHLVEGDWVSLDPQLLKKLPAIPSPTTPPKPPARRKKLQAIASSGEPPRPSPKPEERKGSPVFLKTDEVKREPPSVEEVKKTSPLLPRVPKVPYPGLNVTESVHQPKSPSRSNTTKVPPRPPPPFTKPTQRTTRKTPMLPKLDPEASLTITAQDIVKAVKKASLDRQASEPVEDKKKTPDSTGGSIEHFCKIESLFN